MRAAVVLPAVLLAGWLGAQPEQDKIKIATTNVLTIERVCTIYKSRIGSYPENLEKLTEKQPGGFAAFFYAEALIDPWGRPYRYDAKKLNPTNDYPLIWSDGPDPKDKKGKIMNWVPKEMPDKK